MELAGTWHRFLLGILALQFVPAATISFQHPSPVLARPLALPSALPVRYFGRGVGRRWRACDHYASSWLAFDQALDFSPGLSQSARRSCSSSQPVATVDIFGGGGVTRYPILSWVFCRENFHDIFFQQWRDRRSTLAPNLSFHSPQPRTMK